MRARRRWLAVFALFAVCCSSEPTDEVRRGGMDLVGAPGEVEFPELEMGAAPDLSLLRAEERAVIEEADARAESLRTRPLTLLLRLMHLLNDRWRTRTTTTVGADGALSLPAAAGDYLVQWTADGQTYGAAFELTLGETPVVMRLVAPEL